MSVHQEYFLNDCLEQRKNLFFLIIQKPSSIELKIKLRFVKLGGY